MTTITVQRTGFGIVVAEDGDDAATALLERLPPLRAARYLTATPALRQALHDADDAVVDAVLPHLDGAVVVPEAGFANDGDDGRAAGSTRLAQALGVSVIAPEGRFIPCEGTLFSLGSDAWITESPRGARVRSGRRYPAPEWQRQLPQALPGAAHIPAGLWITAGTDARHAVRLADVAVRERQLLVVVGSPSEPAPSEERLLAVLRALPVETRSAVTLAGFGRGSLPLTTVRALAVALEQPLRVAHGVLLDDAHVRIDGDADAMPAAFALESVCAPDGTVTLERWGTPPGLVAVDAATYRLGETPSRRRQPGDRWLVQVVAAGLVVRPEHAPLTEVAELVAPAGSLGVFLQCDGAHRPAALAALLEPLRARLLERGPVTLHPVDAAARTVVRDAYPGHWAPTEALAITADGRIIAAAADSSGDTEGDDDAGAAGGGDAEPVAVADAREAHEAALASAAGSEREAASATARSARVAADAAAPSAAAASSAAPSADGARATVDAVVGGEGATPGREESAGAASRRARDEHITNVPSVDDAAAAWYAAAAPRRATVEPSAAQAPSATQAPSASRAPSAGAAADAPRAAGSASRTTASASAADEPSAPTTRGLGGSPDAHPTSSVAGAAHVPPSASGAASDALARALQGSASTRTLGGSTRSAVAPSPRSDDRAAAQASAEQASAAQPSAEQPSAERAPAAPAIATQAGSVHALEASDARDAPSETGTDAAVETRERSIAAQLPALDASVGDASPRGSQRSAGLTIEVPADARSTPDQRHRVRTALGSRYDVASRSVSQLLAQQPGMRVATADRSAMLTGLSLVRVFATEPHDDYDLDFHTCLAEGLAMLPTARSVVVRGIPAALDAVPGSLLRLRAPLVAAAANGPATGPSEALIWTTSGRRLDRVLHGAPGAGDVVLPAGVRLRVLGSAAGVASRLLLAEEGADAEQALTRLQAAADARGEVGVHDDDRWFGDLPLAA